MSDCVINVIESKESKSSAEILDTMITALEYARNNKVKRVSIEVKTEEKSIYFSGSDL